MRLLKESELGDLKVDRYYKFISNADIPYYVKIESQDRPKMYNYRGTICYRLKYENTFIKTDEPHSAWDLTPSPSWYAGIREVYELEDEIEMIRDIVMETI